MFRLGDNDNGQMLDGPGSALKNLQMNPKYLQTDTIYVDLNGHGICR